VLVALHEAMIVYDFLLQVLSIECTDCFERGQSSIASVYDLEDNLRLISSDTFGGKPPSISGTVGTIESLEVAGRSDSGASRAPGDGRTGNAAVSVADNMCECIANLFFRATIPRHFLIFEVAVLVFIGVGIVLNLSVYKYTPLETAGWSQNAVFSCRFRLDYAT
jgi:hypothetical protein